MIKHKKIIFCFLLSLTSMLTLSNTAFASTTSKKNQNDEIERIDHSSYKMVIFEKGEFQANICQTDQGKGVYFTSNDGTCDFKLFFKYPIFRTNGAFGKNKILLPNNTVCSAQVITDIYQWEIIKKFPSSNLYEFEDGRDYVLISEDSSRRIDIWTDIEGSVTQLGITFFENRQGMLNYVNAMKILTKEYNIKS